ncbi:MAG TPA: dienelactone hydrolase family protein [Candidatus Nitrosotalea sp.]|nr:dienelactone hydrolase family protein [Candidatus Nitrosotalea sp.]
METYTKRKKSQDNVRIKAGNVELEGNICIPENAIGIVLFAHGSGSSRNSPRNRYVAEELNKRGVATLLFDLLTLEEEAIDFRTAHLRFDIELLARRLVDATEWVLKNPRLARLGIGYFGASTGGGAALVAAAERPKIVKAVVSRGGRPDLAGQNLTEVRCPTLLIVGGCDEPVIELNKNALSILRSEKKLVIVPGATHLFEEPGKLEEVASHACEWFLKYLGGGK